MKVISSVLDITVICIVGTRTCVVGAQRNAVSKQVSFKTKSHITGGSTLGPLEAQFRRDVVSPHSNNKNNSDTIVPPGFHDPWPHLRAT
jgi:hypothetical protein